MGGGGARARLSLRAVRVRVCVNIQELFHTRPLTPQVSMGAAGGGGGGGVAPAPAPAATLTPTPTLTLTTTPATPAIPALLVRHRRQVRRQVLALQQREVLAQPHDRDGAVVAVQARLRLRDGRPQRAQRVGHQVGQGGPREAFVVPLQVGAGRLRPGADGGGDVRVRGAGRAQVVQGGAGRGVGAADEHADAVRPRPRALGRRLGAVGQGAHQAPRREGGLVHEPVRQAGRPHGPQQGAAVRDEAGDGDAHVVVHLEGLRGKKCDGRGGVGWHGGRHECKRKEGMGGGRGTQETSDAPSSLPLPCAGGRPAPRARA